MTRLIVSTKKEIQDWIDKKHHLPPFLKEFRSQEELFRTIHEQHRDDHPKGMSWYSGQLYTMEVFLPFVARYGYALNRCNPHRTGRLIFPEIQDDMRKSHDERRRTAALIQLLDEKGST